MKRSHGSIYYEETEDGYRTYGRRRKVRWIEDSTVFPARPWWARLTCGHKVAVKSRDQKTALCEKCGKH